MQNTEEEEEEDIVDKIFARMEIERVEEEKKASSKALKATNKEIPKSKKPNRQQIRKVGSYIVGIIVFRI